MSTSEAIAVKPGCTHNFTLTAAASCGEIIAVGGGMLGVVATQDGGAIGDTVAVYIDGEFDLLAASGTTFSAGGAVQWNTSTNLAVGSGGTAIGIAWLAKVSGTTRVRTLLNQYVAA